MLLRGTRIPPGGISEQASQKLEVCLDLKAWEQVPMWVEVWVEVQQTYDLVRVLDDSQAAEGLDEVGEMETLVLVEVLGVVHQVEQIVQD